jgi:hypothetical protein
MELLGMTSLSLLGRGGLKIESITIWTHRCNYLVTTHVFIPVQAEKRVAVHMPEQRLSFQPFQG